MKFTAEVIIRTVPFDAKDKFMATVQVAEAFRHIMEKNPDVGQVIEVNAMPVEDID